MHKDLSNEEYVSWRRFLAGAEAWGCGQIEEYQLSEVKRIVRHAYANCRGYRALWKQSGALPEDIMTLQDFRRLPMVQKSVMRDDVEGFSAPVQDRSYVTTGGSTGVPFGFYRDARAFARELASKAHQYQRVGWREGDTQLVFRGLAIQEETHIEFEPEFNELRCSSYFLTPESMEKYRQKAWEYGPQWIRCYPSSGYILARYLKDRGLAFPPVRGILCASENLYDFQKELMSEVFGGRIFSHYGHYEQAVLAGFCEKADTYHVLPQYGLAELVDENGQQVTKNGAIGEIVGTSFIMRATPFVRYRTSDFASLEGFRCEECGRPYQIWRRIEGRLQEFMVTARGRLISMTAINFHDDIFDHVKQFQFLQKRKGEIIFRYIPKEGCTDEVVGDIKRRLRAKMGEDVDLEMARVGDIQLTKRGKHRFLVQELDIEFHDR
jgi:phenylacetate-CoA ligase